MSRLAMVFTLLGAFCATAGGEEWTWSPVGLSGGGAMFAPAISPIDGKCMMVNCDMSAAYLTTDGGTTWRMIPSTQLRSYLNCRPAYSPKDRDVIYAVSGYEGLKVTRDGGATWKAVNAKLPHELYGQIAIDPADVNRMFVGTKDGWLRTTDGGAEWKKCEGPKAQALSVCFDPASPAGARVIFAATKLGIWRSDDGGATWTQKTEGLPCLDMNSFSGAGKGKRMMLYCAIAAKADGGEYFGGVYVSADRGETWESAMRPPMNMDTKGADEWAMDQVCQYHHVLASDADPMRVYAFNSSTGVKPPHHTAVYRSDDGGKTWQATFYPDPRFENYNVQPDYIVLGMKQFFQDRAFGVVIDPRDAGRVMFLDGGRCFLTENAGKSWNIAHSRVAELGTGGKDASWTCTGLVVTTVWNYYIDPHEKQRHYIAYTDIGFARSTDAGKTWRWWSEKTRSPWQNTCYELAFDPAVPGRIWGAFSDVHDIPNGNIIWRGSGKGKGGVCVSNDFAASWKPTNQGLPVAPCMSVVVDPRSEKGSRTLYASMFGEGVYKSADDGRTWAKASTGLGAPANMRTCRLQLTEDGTLLVLITAMRKDGKFLADGAGLWRSRDAGASWELVNKSLPLVWPKDFSAYGKGGETLYIGAARGDKDQSGLYRSTDGGASWKFLGRKGPEHFGAFEHPHKKGWVFMTLTEDAPGEGLWLSKDDGQNWTAVGLPFANAQRVTFDPDDDSVIYVSTFGGSVWKGILK